MDYSKGQRFKASALALLLAIAAGCGGETEAEGDFLDELERLVFVPAGEVNSSVFAPSKFSASVSSALLVDRFEVTRGDLANAGFANPTERGWPEGESGSEDWGVERSTWPACVDFAEATRYAESRGMRLPTSGEWFYIAVGRKGYRYPWGRTKQESIANTLELKIDRPLPVGTFEKNRGEFGTYDQIGNLWEWTTDHVPGIGKTIGAGAGLDSELDLSPYVSAMGGSFTSSLRPLFTAGNTSEAPPSFFAQTLTRGHRSRELGARCVAEAEGYLLRIESELDLSSTSKERLMAVGARWYATGEGDVIDLLEKLIDRPGSAFGLQYLLEGARP